MYKAKILILVMVFFMVFGVVQANAQNLIEDMGRVLRVENDGQGYVKIRLIIESSSIGYNEIILTVDDKTEILDTDNQEMAAADIEPGMQIRAFYGPAVTRSMPPQSYAARIITIPENTVSPKFVFSTEGAEFVAQFLGKTVKLTLPDNRIIVLPIAISASGARYSDGETTFWNKGEEATIDIEGKTYFCRVTDKYSKAWVTAAESGINFRAIGQEPGWILEISDDKQINLVTNYGEERIEALIYKSIGDSNSGTKIYYAETAEQDLIVIAQRKPYADIMSGEIFPYTVTIIRGSDVYRGGGRELR